MLDVRNRELAEVTRADDFIVSDQLISLMLTQISENRELDAVFADLFDPDGSEIYLKPAGDYVEPGEVTSTRSWNPRGGAARSRSASGRARPPGRRGRCQDQPAEVDPAHPRTP